MAEFLLFLRSIPDFLKLFLTVVSTARDASRYILEMVREEKFRSFIKTLGQTFGALAEARGEGSEEKKREAAKQISKLWNDF